MNKMDGSRSEKSLNLLTKKFVQLLLSSKNGVLNLKDVRFRAFFPYATFYAAFMHLNCSLFI